MAKPWYSGPWPRIRLSILQEANYRCSLNLPGCTKQATAVDHIIPISRGGAWFDPQNLRPTCTTCNNQRRTKTRYTQTTTTHPYPPNPSRNW